MKQWTLFMQKSVLFCPPLSSGSAKGGVVVYQHTWKTFAKIPKNTQNSFKYTQNYTQAYFIPEIQRKWYTEYPYLMGTSTLTTE